MIKLIEFSIRHSISTLMVILAIILGGVICTKNIQLDFLPKISEHHILVTAEFEGINAVEMKNLVTKNIESSISSLKGIKNLSSVTRDGLSLTTIELQWNTDIDIALTECRDLIDLCYETLPNNCSKPQVKIFNPNQKNTISIAVIPLSNDLKFCRYTIDNDIKPRMQRILGVSSVNVTGGEIEEIKVIIDRQKLESKSITLQDISSSLSSSNFEYPAGTIREGSKDYLFKTNGLFTSITDIENTTLSYGDGKYFSIKDIATVDYGIKDKETFYLLNGKECVNIGIQKKNDTSPLTLSRNVKKEITKLNELYSNQFEFHITQDTSDQLKDSLKNLLISALIGIIITYVVLFIFIKNNLTSIIVSSIIPLTIIFSTSILYIFGRTINLLSISGITVGIGMVIDPATVTVENIISKLKNEKSVNSYIEGTKETSLSSIGSSLTTIIVFIPLFFLPGIMGKLFTDMAIAVISSIAFACIPSLTYIPSILYYFNKKDINTIKTDQIEAKYEKALTVFFEKKFLIPLTIVFCIIMSVVLVIFLRKEFIPSTNSSIIHAQLTYPEGTQIRRIQSDAYYLTNQFISNPDIEKIEIKGGLEKNNYMELSLPEARQETVILDFFIKNPKHVEKYITQELSKTSLPFTVKSGRNILEELLTIHKNEYLLTEETPEKVLQKTNYITNKTDNIIPYSFVNEYQFTPNRDACTRYNISTLKAAQTARDSLDGVYSSDFYKNGKNTPIHISYKENEFTNADDLLNTMVIIDNSYIPLYAVGTINKIKSEKIFYRYNKKDAKILKNIDTKEHDKELLSLEKQQLNELFSNGIYLLIVIALLLYCTMGAQFQSFTIPILMLVSLPPAFLGAFTALFITQQSLNINSAIALVVLFGTVVNNAIILYESILSSDELSKEAVIKASSRKTKAILITTISTICALIPFSIDPANTNSQVSMSIAIIGGLLFSLFLVLFVIPPLLYKILGSKNVQK